MIDGDKDIVRSLMYSDDENDDPVDKKKKINELKIISSPKSIIIMEKGGVRHQLPTLNVVNAMLNEATTHRNNLRNAQADIKKLSETIKKMDVAIRNLERDMSTKADRYDT